MEGRKQVGSSSSFTSELFGSKEPSSSSGIFGAIFAPSSKELVLGRESLRSEVTGKKLTDEPLHVKPGETVGDSNGSEGESQNMPNKDMSSFYQDQRVQQPCHLSSSIYYGGQDIYSYPQSTQSPGFNSVMGLKMILGVLVEETGGKGLSIIKGSLAEAYTHQGYNTYMLQL
ncbi:hypothetical protein Prudu_017784 [Prunus dulcis]|uniref:Uncharacterized protein n=1 Tax=Prunus dulcis TaxID=3755 RepID=A0A4Y1RQS1_PRUDU|nr:hypothetical protein Prudu_017784 [Prunus dulcis]